MIVRRATTSSIGASESAANLSATQDADAGRGDNRQRLFARASQDHVVGVPRGTSADASAIDVTFTPIVGRGGRVYRARRPSGLSGAETSAEAAEYWEARRTIIVKHYIEDGWSVARMSRYLGVSGTTFTRVLDRLKIDRRSRQTSDVRPITKKTEYNQRWQARHREKYLAHKAVENALARGTLVRQRCERCNSTGPVHAHHDNYERPLDVTWLCPAHHRERHRELAGNGMDPDARSDRVKSSLPSTSGPVVSSSGRAAHFRGSR